MAEDKNQDDGGEEAGPGQAFASFVVMEELLDKLKLLHYDKEFCREFHLKPLNRHYFALQTNPGEQFFFFTSLAAWLIRKCGQAFEPPQEYDDPNSTISNILDFLRGISVSIDFPPSKLKQGYGEQAIFVLDHLANQALKQVHFTWKRPVYPEEEAEEEVIIDDNSEVTLEKVEEEMLNYDYEDEDDEGLINIEDIHSHSQSKESDTDTDLIQNDFLTSSTDTTEWRLEVERVLPHLKVIVKSDGKDWRAHLEEMRQRRDEIDESLSFTKSNLDKLHTEISRTLEKISSREKYLNSQMEQLLQVYRASQDQLAQTKEQYRSVSGGVTERSRNLAQITEELEQIKQEMDERGSSVTDGTPLVNIRKSLNRLKTEISQMDVRIGVAAHTLLQAKLKEKGNLQQASKAPIHAASIDTVY